MIFLQIIACLGALILPLMSNSVKKVDKHDKLKKVDKHDK